MNYRNVIDKWPSLTDFADDIGVSENTAKQMRTRDSINSRHWSRLVAAAEGREIEGVTLDSLASIAAAEREVA